MSTPVPTTNTGSKVSTPDVGKSNIYLILVGILIFAIILIAMTKIINKNERESSNVSSKSETSSPVESNSLLDHYVEIKFLKKGEEPILVIVPSGYKYTCSGGGKKYYHKAQNEKEPELWGDGTFHTSGNRVGFFELSYYDEEISVICEFNRIKK